ncbi:MAG: phosphoribosylformylglycinamidine synthase subunit PurS [Asgard group archaeon]|nr:phosphoribosylformylglycinamidine synthase subunit PurS [Asgard group archaeon]
MPEFLAEIIIEGKPNARDPEGETIMHDLMIKHGFEMVESVRSGKILKVTLTATTAKEAKEICLRMVDELRIYNPVAHRCTIEIVK